MATNKNLQAAMKRAPARARLEIAEHRSAKRAFMKRADAFESQWKQAMRERAQVADELKAERLSRLGEGRVLEEFKFSLGTAEAEIASLREILQKVRQVLSDRGEPCIHEDLIVRKVVDLMNHRDLLLQRVAAAEAWRAARESGA